MAEFNFIDRIQTREPFFFHVKRPYNVVEVTLTRAATATPLDIVAGFPLNRTNPTDYSGVITSDGAEAATYAALAGLALEARHVEPGETVTLVCTDPYFGYGILLKAENYATYNNDPASGADYGKQTIANWLDSTLFPNHAALAAALQEHGYKFLTGIRPAQS